MLDVKVVDNMIQNSFYMVSNGDVLVRYKCGNSEVIGDQEFYVLFEGKEFYCWVFFCLVFLEKCFQKNIFM